ncbi:DBP [turkey adenovirus 5]|uniref:DNA-binding protein n=1 Tax=turkey adenovirus 5 TaxID=1408258 RepID=U5NEM3_9ADEN|nr:DBP [Turkey aviadenovirus 5]AGX93343.1 DBP [Turkey aviadenovirus 5]
MAEFLDREALSSGDESDGGQRGHPRFPRSSLTTSLNRSNRPEKAVEKQKNRELQNANPGPHCPQKRFQSPPTIVPDSEEEGEEQSFEAQDPVTEAEMLERTPKGAVAHASRRPAKRTSDMVEEEEETQDFDKRRKRGGAKRVGAREESPSPVRRTARRRETRLEIREDDEVDQEPDDEEMPSLSDPIVYGAQRAMGIIASLCEAMDLQWQGATVRPDDSIWTKMGGTYIRKRHSDFRLTFSTYDSFNAQVGRFLAAMIYSKAGLEPKFVPGGAHVWRHGWFYGREDPSPKCMHGAPMARKPRTVELNPSSEAGKRALSEQNGSIEKNRFGRQVVVLRFDANVVCYKDGSHNGFPHPHAHGSCGMVFSDAEKAMSALRHDIDWTKAIYPNAERKRAEECVLISTNCNCNYASDRAISGRQLCKMTPYKLSGTDDISKEMLDTRADMRAHKKNPHTMVFTCCNPQTASGGSPRGPKKGEKTCAWRLSAMDLRYAYVFATELFASVMGGTEPTHVPEFKWNDSFAFKTDVLTPVSPLQSEDPFA